MCTSLSATNNSRRDINKQLAEMYVYVCARETSSGKGWSRYLSTRRQCAEQIKSINVRDNLLITKRNAYRFSQNYRVFSGCSVV